MLTGLVGIEQKLSPPDPVGGNAYDLTDADAERLPRDLGEAADALDGSAVAREWLGDAFVDHYAATRMWEVREHRKAITNWELERYFEII